jgi:hypothetical protein
MTNVLVDPVLKKRGGLSPKRFWRADTARNLKLKIIDKKF